MPKGIPNNSSKAKNKPGVKETPQVEALKARLQKELANNEALTAELAAANKRTDEQAHQRESCHDLHIKLDKELDTLYAQRTRLVTVLVHEYNYHALRASELKTMLEEKGVKLSVPFVSDDNDLDSGTISKEPVR